MKKPSTTTKTYTVKKEDSLWEISARYLGSGSRYREIMKLKDRINDKRFQKMNNKLTKHEYGIIFSVF